jgi:hypothetical protein
MANKNITLDEILSTLQKVPSYKKEVEKIAMYIYKGYIFKIVFNHEKILKNNGIDNPTEADRNEVEKILEPYKNITTQTHNNVNLALVELLETAKDKDIDFKDLKYAKTSLERVSYIFFKENQIILEEDSDSKEFKEYQEKINNFFADWTKIGSSYEEILYKAYKLISINRK